MREFDDELEMSWRHEPTRTTKQKDPSSQGPHNGRARWAAHEDVASLVPACSGARVCHEQGREDSTGSADGSINSAELVQRCPLTTRRLVKRVQRRLHESEVADVRRATAERRLASRTKCPRRQSMAKMYERNGLEVLGNKALQTCAVPAGSRRQCHAQDSAGMNGLKRKIARDWDLRTQERKEHSQLQADRKQPSVVSRFTRHRAPNKMVETPGATERKVPTLQSSTEASTVQTVLKVWKLSSRSSRPSRPLSRRRGRLD